MTDHADLEARLAAWGALADHGIDTPEAVLDLSEFASHQRFLREQLTKKLAAVAKVEEELRDKVRTVMSGRWNEGFSAGLQDAADLIAAALKGDGT